MLILPDEFIDWDDIKRIPQREQMIFFTLANAGIPTKSLQIMVQDKHKNIDVELLDSMVCLSLFMNHHLRYETPVIVDTLLAFLSGDTLDTACFREMKDAYLIMTQVKQGLVHGGSAKKQCAGALLANQHTRFDTQTVAEGILAVHTHCIISDNPCFRELFVLPFASVLN